MLDDRVRQLNFGQVSRGSYVLYWMAAAQRGHYNHALEYAVGRANELGVAVLAVFGLIDAQQGGNLRHYTFMLQGLGEVASELDKRGIGFVVKKARGETAAIELSTDACCVVVDAGHTRAEHSARANAAEKIECLFEEVETNLIVPVWQASDKENFSAGVFRPRITKLLDKYMVKLTRRKVKHPWKGPLQGGVDVSNIEDVLSEMDIDRSVGPAEMCIGGTSQAKRRLKKFISQKLADYAELRNDPTKDYTSSMSPYLHFGQISPLYVALEVARADLPGGESYLEELIVRRELSSNFVYYNDRYDSFDGLADWAKRSLNLHKRDERQYVYTVEQFENAQTHDPYWNAAQMEMVVTGKMHGYMRMYWGKKILEWSVSLRDGFDIAIYLNNKYELDGGGPNAYAGVAWCFGKHDRAWSEREVFGKVRYMNAAGLKRKFDAEAYIEKVARLSKKIAKKYSAD